MLEHDCVWCLPVPSPLPGPAESSRVFSSPARDMSLCTLQVPNYDPSEYHTERLYARYAEDKSLDDAARILRRSTSWVKVNLHRARNRLKVRLEEPSAWLTLKDT